ncbi:hypothetical protein BDZ97DRAFT_236021 [Flammula alnicola]|nr:hypothetical protein BDZ97DRAFT_236021 [Flammula alnicola]
MLNTPQSTLTYALMFVLFLLLTFIRTLQGAPVSPPASLDIEYTTLAVRDTGGGGCLHSRTGWDISWSCIITIFACTWSAVHPNIPGPRDSGWTCFKRRIVTMFYATVAPEMMVSWAMRQYFGARMIMRDYNEHIAKATPPTFSIFECVREWFKGPPVVKQGPGAVRPWTITHGFFVQMGGFLLCKGGKPIRSLDYEGLKKLITDEAIDIPTITEIDIKDRSKGDFISKGIVVLQTTWFIIQCATRWAEKLPLTELEVVTLAFAVLNGIIYGLWWNKPQNVGVAVYVEEKKVGTEGDDDGDADTVGSETDAMMQKVGWLRRKLKKDFEDVEFLTSWLRYLLVEMPERLVKAVLHPLDKMADDYQMPYGALRVPMFYAQGFDDSYDNVVMNASLAIGILFGLMHLLAWSLDFPSRTEQLLWRTSALVITVEPAWLGLAELLAKFVEYDDWLWWVSLPGMLGIPLYIIARIFLLTEAFLSLRALPTAAYQSIEWTSIIPHL